MLTVQQLSEKYIEDVSKAPGLGCDVPRGESVPAYLLSIVASSAMGRGRYLSFRRITSGTQIAWRR